MAIYCCALAGLWVFSKLIGVIYQLQHVLDSADWCSQQSPYVSSSCSDAQQPLTAATPLVEAVRTTTCRRSCWQGVDICSPKPSSEHHLEEIECRRQGGERGWRLWFCCKVHQVPVSRKLWQLLARPSGFTLYPSAARSCGAHQTTRLQRPWRLLLGWLLTLARQSCSWRIFQHCSIATILQVTQQMCQFIMEDFTAMLSDKAPGATHGISVVL